MPSVASLHVYPVKGAARMTVERWPVDERGLRHDRRFMLITADNRFVSQRNCPKLALVRTAIEGDALLLACTLGEVSVPLTLTNAQRVSAVVWDDSLECALVSSAADDLFTRFLQLPCRLVWMPDDAARLTPSGRGDPRRRVSLADRAPVLLTTEASLEDLNTRLERGGAARVPMDRFRPNIVVTGVASGLDDDWCAIAIGPTRFRVTNACKRCQVVTIDQATGALQGAEPLRTLATYRRDGDSVAFGQHLLADAFGTIAVGDEIDVRAGRGETFPSCARV
ncbi:MAG: MOSC domain-containing protein [Phycisphaerae bacterium]|nr:MOSC domain-containing protein [Phycisphaerae bacterium]